MDDINDYLIQNFEQLPLSHQNFIATAINKEAKSSKVSGKNINKRYRLLYLDFNSFYKPITCYLK
jgi:hypothetical protein